MKASTPGIVNIGDNPTPEQKGQAQKLITAFSSIFSTRPGRTHLITHHIQTEPGIKVRENPQPLPQKLREAMKDQLRSMLALGVIEELFSD